MDRANMLSATKVKQHGMISEKWTTKDKIVQYKGLINLYTRDKKIMEMDVAMAKKKQTQEMKMLQTEIDLNRKKLDNACGGDKQKLRNALANHRILQMAFCRSTPTKVIDLIHQVSFTKRKKRDILNYKMKVESDKLIDLKLECSVYEDRLKYEGDKIMLPSEKEAHLITGKVQDAILKKEAAIYIRNSYNEMIAIMKKDAIYFDAILASLRNDGVAQGRCMINATVLGQLGIEYLDDRRQEYQYLEKIVKADLASRKKDIAVVQQNVEAFTDNLKNLIRTDSDINLGKITMEKTLSFHMLQKEIETIESTLQFLKESFFTASFDQIFPCLKEQMRQKERLAQFIQKCETNRNDLLEKAEKAAVTCSNLKNTMVETTKVYNSEKVSLRADIKFEIERASEFDVTIKARYSLLAKVRIALRHMQYLAWLLAGTDSAQKLARLPTIQTSGVFLPEKDEADGTLMVEELKTKFKKLAASAQVAREVMAATKVELSYRFFELLMRERSKPVEIPKVSSEESFMQSESSDSQVLSREDIKKRSAEIVIEGLAALEYKPPPPPTKKKYKFKK